VAGIPFEEVRVSIARQEQRQAEYLGVNPLGKVPALRDGDVCLPESAAIMQYLADTRAVPDHWYPSELGVGAKGGSV
jgi:glutathione S-transferase